MSDTQRLERENALLKEAVLELAAYLQYIRDIVLKDDYPKSVAVVNDVLAERAEAIKLAGE